MKSFATILILAIGVGVGSVSAQQPLIGGDPLVSAVLARDAGRAKALLLAGSQPQGRDLGRRPLTVIAVSNNDVAMLTLLLDYGANANETDGTGNSPLSQASALGNIDAVDRLIAAGAQVNWANQQGMTPLMRAAQAGAVGVIRRLLDAGALVDLTDFTGRDALSWAESSNHQRAAQILRDALAGS
ncbi:MAG: ankyrin repeat domain-containing protein [Alphaproteobacteria bacterium]